MWVEEITRLAAEYGKYVVSFVPKVYHCVSDSVVFLSPVHHLPFICAVTLIFRKAEALKARCVAVPLGLRENTEQYEWKECFFKTGRERDLMKIDLMSSLFLLCGSDEVI